LLGHPNLPIALHLLGVIAHQVGKNEIAVDMIKGALFIKHDYAEVHNNLGLTLQKLGRLDEAIIPMDKRPIVNYKNKLD
jgi:Tfp pilus assembly protein PilF